jgi:hypothetical protein
MPRFKVPVVGDELEQAQRALRAANISTLGSSSSFVASGEGASTGYRMTAMLEADSEEAAVQRVREAVGDGYEVGPAEPMGDR